jgi:vancomycin permeability regulator SanA
MPEAGPPPRARRRWGWWLGGSLASVVVLIGAADAYVVAATRAREVGSVAEAPAVPDAMVLGNRVFPGGVPSAELAYRLEVGRALYAAGRAHRLIVSGLARPDLDYDEPAGMAAWLEAHGVPPADVILDRGGYRTAASMADAAASGVHRLLVVSQAYHLPRALYLARAAGIDAWGVPAPSHRSTFFSRLRISLRENAARAETVLEVLVRGVRGAGPPR